MAWWYSQDEERWNGPETSREAAIAEGRGEYPGEQFMIVEAETDDYDMTVDADLILDVISDRNEERTDPDGDGPFDQVTRMQKDDLAMRVNAAIVTWVRVHNISIRAWAFVVQGPIERIEAKDDECLR